MYEVPHGDRCMHEFVASARTLRREKKISAMDVGKRLLDHGYPRPDGVLPARRPGGPDDGADRNREQGDARRLRDVLLKIVEEDAALLAKGPAHAADQPAGRGEGGEGAGPAVDRPLTVPRTHPEVARVRPDPAADLRPGSDPGHARRATPRRVRPDPRRRPGPGGRGGPPGHRPARADPLGHDRGDRPLQERLQPGPVLAAIPGLAGGDRPGRGGPAAELPRHRPDGLAEPPRAPGRRAAPGLRGDGVADRQPAGRLADPDVHLHRPHLPERHHHRPVPDVRHSRQPPGGEAAGPVGVRVEGPGAAAGPVQRRGRALFPQRPVAQWERQPVRGPHPVPAPGPLQPAGVRPPLRPVPGVAVQPGRDRPLHRAAASAARRPPGRGYHD